MKNPHLFVPVRRCEDDGHEWMDMMSARCLLEMTITEIERSAERIPAWHTANPVVRIVTVTITEGETVWTPEKAERTKREKRERYMPVLNGYVLDMEQHGKLIGTVDHSGAIKDR